MVEPGAVRTEQEPEFRGMVWLDKVGDFMSDDVVEDFGWRHDETPVEGQISLSGAVAPLGALVHNVKPIGHAL